MFLCFAYCAYNRNTFPWFSVNKQGAGEVLASCIAERAQQREQIHLSECLEKETHRAFQYH